MRRRGCREDLRVRKPAGKVSESLPMKAYIHGKMYEAKSDICFFVAMRPKKSSGGETLLQKKQMSVCLFAEKMCPQKQDYLQGDIIDGDDSIRVSASKRLGRTHVKTQPYPGYPTDMQPQIAGL